MHDELRLQNDMLTQELQALRQSAQESADNVRSVSPICFCVHKAGSFSVLSSFTLSFKAFH